MIVFLTNVVLGHGEEGFMWSSGKTRISLDAYLLNVKQKLFFFLFFVEFIKYYFLGSVGSVWLWRWNPNKN
jgi:hypothetical protein